MIEVRALEPEEVAPACVLLHEWLRPGSQFDLAREYPLVYGQGSAARLCGVFDQGTLVSHGALRCVEITVDRRRVRIGLIGSVATSPAARAKGHARRAVSRLEAWAAKDGASGTLLWSDRRNWYGRMGYVPVGSETHVVLERERSARADVVPRAAGPADASDLLALHERKPVHVRRTCEEFAALLAIPGLKTFVVAEGGRTVAYACLGKGEDLPDTVHEVGGEDGVVDDLVRGVLDTCGAQRLKVMVPPYRDELRVLLGRDAIGGSEGILGLGKGREGVFEGVWVDGLDSV